MKTKATPRQLKILYAYCGNYEGEMWIYFIPWGAQLRNSFGWPQEYSGDSVTWTKEVQHVVFQQSRHHQLTAYQTGKLQWKPKNLHHSLKTFMLEAAISATWYSGCWTSIAVSQISYPMWEYILYQKKIPGLESLFVPYIKIFLYLI